MKVYCIYILANKWNSVLYVGMTSDLTKRLWEHKQKLAKGFAAKYNCDKFVYFEGYETPEEAILREKQIKKYGREKKINLVESINPNWKELATHY